MLRAAKWRAARYGLEDELVDVEEGRALPARVFIEKLLAHLRPALEEYQDWEEVSEIVQATLARGNGAARQRAAFRRSDSFADVVELIMAETTI
jgi:carboxylate-amine ligase